MTDTVDESRPLLPLHLRVNLSAWATYRRAVAKRRRLWQEGQLCLFQPEHPTLTVDDVETSGARPRQSSGCC